MTVTQDYKNRTVAPSLEPVNEYSLAIRRAVEVRRVCVLVAGALTAAAVLGFVLDRLAGTI